MQTIDSPPRLGQAYMDNSQWLVDHLAELQRDHPNQWVAIAHGRVVAADAELGVVTVKASQVATPADTVFHFVDDGTFVLALLN